MTKLLKDNLGRIVGKVEVAKSVTGNVEYGVRREDGILDVCGIASIISISAARKEHGDNDSFDMILEELQAYEC